MLRQMVYVTLAIPSLCRCRSDGAQDGEPFSHAVPTHRLDAKVVIPPQKTKVPSLTGYSQRNRHIEVIAE